MFELHVEIASTILSSGVLFLLLSKTPVAISAPDPITRKSSIFLTHPSYEIWYASSLYAKINSLFKIGGINIPCSSYVGAKLIR